MFHSSGLIFLAICYFKSTYLSITLRFILHSWLWCYHSLPYTNAFNGCVALKGCQHRGTAENATSQPDCPFLDQPATTICTFYSLDSLLVWLQSLVFNNIFLLMDFFFGIFQHIWSVNCTRQFNITSLIWNSPCKKLILCWIERQSNNILSNTGKMQI